jgi:hypothetical protein
MQIINRICSKTSTFLLFNNFLLFFYLGTGAKSMRVNRLIARKSCGSIFFHMLKCLLFIRTG